MTKSIWTINELEYFEAPALSVLVFHDTYPEGKQGGLEIIQHGERVATNGDLRLEPTPGQWAVLPEVGQREADRKRGTVKVSLAYPKHDLSYALRVEEHGESLRVHVDLESPLPPELAGKVSFNLELFPAAYYGKTFYLGETIGVFPRQANGPMVADAEGKLQGVRLAAGSKLSIAPEDPLRRMVIEQIRGGMELLDGRNAAQNGWFVLRSVVPADVVENAVEWVITPHRIPGWRREPVICISQVGYHPDQIKRAIIELDPQTEKIGEAILWRIEPEGQMSRALSAPVEKWGRFLCYEYVLFDFTGVQEPGMYTVSYGEQTTLPFRIGRDVYQNGVWQPTLETFLPVQMCHVEVRDRYRVWHGACHLDDALQAPPSLVHFDGYAQGATTETAYSAYQHIPGLNRGGWHDAGDYDLPAGSEAQTTFVLSLIRETFGLDSDQTTVRQHERLVKLHTPDGIPDIVQQIAHGVENLLSGYRAAGHSFSGIIVSTLEQYVHLGDGCSMTDNRVYDPSLAPDEVAGERSGKRDDRWAFTSRSTSLEYQVITGLAAASRVLRGYEETLAQECLETAVKTWDYEQAHKPAQQTSAYIPGRFDVQEVSAAAELLITTRDERYRQRLVELLPVIAENIGQVGWTVARVLPWMENEDFAGAIENAVKRLKADTEAELSKNPFGVPYQPAIWGIGWGIQDHAMKQYYLIKSYPELFNRESVLRALNYVLGCHPGSNISFVSGVGAKSLTAAYGANRDDWSYIPGGVASGTNLVRPDFPELKDDFPFLWQQSEYVIGGAATYIFCVLAADELLNG